MEAQKLIATLTSIKIKVAGKSHKFKPADWLWKSGRRKTNRKHVFSLICGWCCDQQHNFPVSGKQKCSSCITVHSDSNFKAATFNQMNVCKCNPAVFLTILLWFTVSKLVNFVSIGYRQQKKCSDKLTVYYQPAAKSRQTTMKVRDQLVIVVLPSEVCGERHEASSRLLNKSLLKTR